MGSSNSARCSGSTKDSNRTARIQDRYIDITGSSVRARARGVVLVLAICR